MARDLEEFLRRAAQRRNQQQKATPPAPQKQVPPSASSRGRLAQQRPQSSLGSVKPGRNVGSSSIAVDQADERLDTHLHESFDHELGTLAGPTKSVTASDKDVVQVESVSVIDELMDLLKSPQGIQQAVLLREILERPTDRWK